MMAAEKNISLCLRALVLSLLLSGRCALSFHLTTTTSRQRCKSIGTVAPLQVTGRFGDDNRELPRQCQARQENSRSDGSYRQTFNNNRQNRLNDKGDDVSPTTIENPGLLSSRRDLFRASAATVVAGSALASWIQPVQAAASPPLTIVMTGANSGIGYEACKRLAAQGHSIVMACRTLTKAQEAASTITSGTLIPAECDLANLQSIRQFVSDLPKLIGGSDAKIDRLCLNAGLARNTAATDCARTADGFELTVGTNHFGHFYLNQLALPLVNSQSGRIVVTASGVHDPASPGGAQGVPATLGKLEGLETQGKDCEMIDGGAFNADKAYKDSKLCNVFFTRELQKRLSGKGSKIVANCFNPGLIVGTGLFRDQNKLFTKVFDVAATDLLKVGETPEWGGGCLSYMATQVTTAGGYYGSDPGSSKYGDAAYGNQFSSIQPSEEAQDEAKGKRLWALSEQVLGLS